MAFPCSSGLEIGGVPVQLYCNDVDTNAWRDTAATLKARVRAAWNDAARRGVIPPEIYEFVTLLEKEYCDADADGVCQVYHLPEASIHPILGFGRNAAACSQISAWCQRAACAVELLDQVRGFKGPAIPVPPKGPDLIPGGNWGLWIGIGLVAVVVLGLRSRGRSE